MLFLGTYPYAMDERGRVPIPPRFRDSFLSGVILTQGTPDQCVRIYPLTGFEEQAAIYMSEPATQRQGRVMRRSFFSSAYQVEMDRQGRVLVPPQLRRWAALEGDVVVLGLGEWMEIWDAERFEAVSQEEQRSLETE